VTSATLGMQLKREQRAEQALFLGRTLTLENARYREAVRRLSEALLRDDIGQGDLTAKSLEIRERDVSAAVISRAGGIVAGLEELASLFQERGIGVAFEKRDGNAIRPDEILLRLKGSETKLLELERVGLNLVQRMSGVATAAHCLNERARRSGTARVVGTRKTPWGLLDKRALHVGGAGTHRLGLGDAILIKNNHLALLAKKEEEAVPIAIERAWKFCTEAAFIEVEVRSAGAARVAAQTFREFQDRDARRYPCLVMLDNMTPEQIGEIIKMLQGENLWDCILIEASGGISEANIEAYAATGVDAISIGALTHSARALDICLRIS
jgi:nicotinate-nucleotide pyrophosphorylase (carboxylating)